MFLVPELPRKHIDDTTVVDVKGVVLKPAGEGLYERSGAGAKVAVHPVTAGPVLAAIFVDERSDGRSVLLRHVAPCALEPVPNHRQGRTGRGNAVPSHGHVGITLHAEPCLVEVPKPRLNHLEALPGSRVEVRERLLVLALGVQTRADAPCGVDLLHELRRGDRTLPGRHRLYDDLFGFAGRVAYGARLVCVRRRRFTTFRSQCAKNTAAKPHAHLMQAEDLPLVIGGTETEGNEGSSERGNREEDRIPRGRESGIRLGEDGVEEVDVWCLRTPAGGGQRNPSSPPKAM